MNYVLIVDDNASIRRLLKITLGKQFEVLEADDGVSALQTVLRYQPEIVLLDVMMPGEMDGLQVLEKIKGDPRIGNTLVAMLTARGQQKDRDVAMRLGADAYFDKPFSPLLVANWVKRHSTLMPAPERAVGHACLNGSLRR
jgi:CheY-like chemotaxis protein